MQEKVENREDKELRLHSERRWLRHSTALGTAGIMIWVFVFFQAFAIKEFTIMSFRICLLELALSFLFVGNWCYSAGFVSPEVLKVEEKMRKKHKTAGILFLCYSALIVLFVSFTFLA